jgi:hypothetical protein
MGTLYRSDGVTWDRIGDGAVLALKIEGWHNVGAAGEPAFQNGWVNFTATAQPPLAFKKYPDGRVRLQGIITSGTVGAIFTLPVGYRPVTPAGGALRFRVPAGLAAGDGQVDIGGDGTVNAAGSLGGAGVWADLGAVEFDTGQTTWPAGQGSSLGVVTSLPVAPVDGQECYFLADATNGVVWHFKYRAASTSPRKWECIGGSPLFVIVGYVDPPSGGVESKSGASSNIYGPLATPVSITLPLAGDYDVDHGFSGNTNASTYAYQSLSIGGAVPLDGDAATEYDTAGAMVPVSRSVRKTGLAAATTVAAQYRTYAANQSLGVNNRWIRAKPVRVG